MSENLVVMKNKTVPYLVTVKNSVLGLDLVAYDRKCQWSVVYFSGRLDVGVTGLVK